MSSGDCFNNKPYHQANNASATDECLLMTTVNSESKRRKLVGNMQFTNRMATLSEYSCTYCYRKYHSAQALGGHQNAHKRERSATLSTLTAFGYNKHRHNNQHHHLNSYAYSGTSSSSLFSSPLPTIKKTSLGILVRSRVENPAVYSALPSSSWGPSQLYPNHKHHLLQKHVELECDYADLADRHEGPVNICSDAGSSSLPLTAGATTLDLTLKL